MFEGNYDNNNIDVLCVFGKIFRKQMKAFYTNHPVFRDQGNG